MKKGKEVVLKNLVFEIGSEELPATNLADIFETAAAEKAENPLLEKWKKIFKDNRISFGDAKVWATPRRLVFFLSDVGASQEKKDVLTRVLMKSEAYDSNGKPTEKFLMILKHRNVLESDTVISDFNGKEAVFIKKAEPVRKTLSALPEILETFTKNLGFPKNMKWDDSGLYFPRPIRHTLCFYGNQAVKFKIGSARSSDRVWFFSKGKRWSVAASDGESYFRTLKKQGVILDPEERKKAIQEILEKLAKSSQGGLYEDPFLLAEVNYLVEQPEGLAAPFDEEFLKLPLEVLTVSMARKQRIFGLVDNSGKVLPRFLAVMDGSFTASDKKSISANYENILHAKLQDSLFFYKEDLKISLDKKREELKNLIFLKGAGSMFEKTERLTSLSKKISKELSLPDHESRSLEKAAYLSKSDLLTHMVGEFPELQGIIGKYYAMENGEEKNAALAIGEQYLPRTVSDKLPHTITGSLLSLLDKIDLIVACFLLGLEPTSSMDPYGLRRSGASLIKIALSKKFNFSLPDLIREAASLHKIAQPKHSAEQLLQKLCGEQGFFWDRFRAVAGAELGGDLIDAVTATRRESFVEVYERALFLKKIQGKEPFQKACKVVERTHNILKGNKETLPNRPDEALFTEALERSLHEALQRHESGILGAKKEGDFAKATNLYAEAFFDILNEFFDKVFINAEDLNVRRNRLSLLKAIKELYTGDIADLSKIRI